MRKKAYTITDITQKALIEATRQADNLLKISELPKDASTEILEQIVTYLKENNILNYNGVTVIIEKPGIAPQVSFYFKEAAVGAMIYNEHTLPNIITMLKALDRSTKNIISTHTKAEGSTVTFIKTTYSQYLFLLQTEHIRLMDLIVRAMPGLAMPSDPIEIDPTLLQQLSNFPYKDAVYNRLQGAVYKKYPLEVVKALVGFDRTQLSQVKPMLGNMVNFAYMAGHGGAVKYFINSGISLEVRNGKDQTLLMECSEKGDIDMVRYLLEHGAQVNALDKKSGMPGAILYALSKLHSDIVELLIEHGSHLPIRNEGPNISHVFLINADADQDSFKEALVHILLKVLFKNAIKALESYSISAPHSPLAVVPEVATLDKQKKKKKHKKKSKSISHVSVEEEEPIATEDAPAEVQEPETFASCATLERSAEVTGLSVRRDLTLMLDSGSREKIHRILQLYKQMNPVSTVEDQIISILFDALSATHNQMQILQDGLFAITQESPEASAAIIAIAHSLGAEVIGDPKEFILSLATDPNLLHKYFSGEFHKLLITAPPAANDVAGHSWFINGEVITSANSHVRGIISTKTKSKFFIYIPEKIWSKHEGLLNKLFSKDLKFIPQGSNGINGVKIFDHVAELKIISETDGQGDVRLSSDSMYKNEENDIVIVFNYDTNHAEVFDEYSRKKKIHVTNVPSFLVEQEKHGDVDGVPGVSTASLLVEKTNDKAVQQQDKKHPYNTEALATTAFVFGVSIGALLEAMKNNELMAKFIQKIFGVFESLQKKPCNIAEQIAKDLEKPVEEKFKEDNDKPQEEKPDAKQAEKTNLHKDDFFFFAGGAGVKLGVNALPLVVFEDPLKAYVCEPIKASAEYNEQNDIVGRATLLEGY